MTAKWFKPIVASVLLVTVVGFAAWRVAPLVRARPGLGQNPHRAVIAKSLEDTAVPQYDTDQLAADIPHVRAAVRDQVRVQLTALPEQSRPDETSASAIADEYADYFALHRAGTLSEAVARMSDRGVQPPRTFVPRDGDPERAELAWRQTATWARHRPVDIDALAVEPRFVRGRQVSPAHSEGAQVNRRPLGGGVQGLTEPHNFTAYEVLYTTVVPNIDNKSEFTATVAITIVNDGPGGSWRTAETTWRGVPLDKIFVLPHP